MHLLNMPHAGAYEVLYVDTPWQYRSRSAKGQGKSPSRHYRTPPLRELQALPVGAVAAPRCWLIMWTTWPQLMVDTPALVAAWSDPANPWTYCTGGAWAKRPRNWRGGRDTWQFGPGHVFRTASEVLLVYQRGHPPWLATNVRNLWTAPIREHSRKPDEVRTDIARATRGPRLEMFARSTGPGFDAWGMEAGKFDG